MAKLLSISRSPFFSKRNIIWIAVVFTALLYANTLRNSYNLDDELVTINHRLTSKGISAIPEIFRSPYYQDDMGYSYEYRPVVLASFAIENHFFGDNAAASHFINIVLYVLCVIVFIKVVSGIFAVNNTVFLLFSVFLFVAHPLHTEVVASIKNRDELLSLLGGLMSFYFVFKFIEKGSYFYLIPITVFLLAGLLSKMSAFSFVIIIPIWMILYNVSLKKIIVVTFFLIIAIVLVLLLRNFELYQVTFVAFALALFLFMIFLFHRFRFINYFSLSYFQNSFSYPVGNLVNKLSTADVIVFGFTVVTVVYAYISKNLIPLIPSLGAIFILPYLTKKYSLYNLLLPTLLIAFSACFLQIKHIEWLYFVYLISVLNTIMYFSRSNVIIYLGVLILFASGYSFKAQDFVVGFEFIIMPLGFLTFDIFFKKYKVNKKFIVMLWICVMFIFIVPVSFFTGKFNSALLILPACGILFQLIERKNLNRILLLSIWVFFVFSAFNIPSPFVKFYFNEKKETGKTELYLIEPLNKKEEIVMKTKDIERASSQVTINKVEDRPIDFVEFPLGFNPTFSEKYGTVSYVLGYYLKLMAIPYPMCFYYGFNKINVVTLSSPWVILSVILHLFLIISALYFIRKHPVYSIGVFAYLSSIFLFSNLASPVAGMIGDRLTFVASFGFCIAVGYILSHLYEKASQQKKKLIIGLFTLVLIIYSGITISRNAQWKNHMTLYKHDIKYLEESAQAHNLLAKRLLFESFQERSSEKQYNMRLEGIKHYERAIAIYPDFFNPHIDLGKAYLLVNRLEDAARLYLQAAELDSTYYDSWLQAGGIFMELKKLPQAVFCFNKVIEKDKSYLQAYTSLSQVYFMQKNFDKAIEINLQAMKIAPSAYDPVVNIGKTYFTMGDKKNALVYFEKAYLLNSHDGNLLVTMANIYKEFGDNNKADFYFSKANQLPR